MAVKTSAAEICEISEIRTPTVQNSQNRTPISACVTGYLSCRRKTMAVPICGQWRTMGVLILLFGKTVIVAALPDRASPMLRLTRQQQEPTYD